PDRRRVVEPRSSIYCVSDEVPSNRLVTITLVINRKADALISAQLPVDLWNRGGQRGWFNGIVAWDWWLLRIDDEPARSLSPFRACVRPATFAARRVSLIHHFSACHAACHLVLVVRLHLTAFFGIDSVDDLPRPGDLRLIDQDAWGGNPAQRQLSYYPLKKLAVNLDSYPCLFQEAADHVG